MLAMLYRGNAREKVYFVMKNLKIFAVAIMLLTAGTPVMADNEKDGELQHYFS